MRSGKNRFLRGLLVLAVLALALGLIAGCGKKAEDTDASAQSSVIHIADVQQETTDQNGASPAAGSDQVSDVSDQDSVQAESETEDTSEQSVAGEPEQGAEETVSKAASGEDNAEEKNTGAGIPDENGSYTSKDEVAAYIHEYGHLPDNFITKDEARDLGWDSKAGNLQEVAPGMSIGGDRFGNYEGLLPEAKKRKYYECDINYSGGRRGAERIIYSNDGLIFYTGDHYESFEQLY